MSMAKYTPRAKKMAAHSSRRQSKPRRGRGGRGNRLLGLVAKAALHQTGACHSSVRKAGLVGRAGCPSMQGGSACHCPQDRARTGNAMTGAFARPRVVEMFCHACGCCSVRHTAALIHAGCFNIAIQGDKAAIRVFPGAFRDIAAWLHAGGNVVLITAMLPAPRWRERARLQPMAQCHCCETAMRTGKWLDRLPLKQM